MRTKKDEKILYDSYCKFGDRKKSKSGKTGSPEDVSIMEKLKKEVSLVIMRLNGSNPYSAVEIQKNLFKAKNMFIQYSHLRARNGLVISPWFIRKMDEMMKAVCAREADQISDIRKRETGGQRIDIAKIFEVKRNQNHLGQMLARDIVSESIYVDDSGKKLPLKYYITDKGRKYHVSGCPYCKGKNLSAVSKEIVENLRLEPCKCMNVNTSYVTAFVDESIHLVKWDKNGHRGRIGSFSYIICKGLLKNEDSITDNIIIAKGVESIPENENLQRVTEAAIGKVLLALIYDMEFDGHVRIFTDNKGVVDSWKRNGLNSKLVTHFQSVSVSYIKRVNNTKADLLGRTRRLLDIPIETYNDLIHQHDRIKDLEKQLKEKEAMIQILRDHDEIIVAENRSSA